MAVQAADDERDGAGSWRTLQRIRERVPLIHVIANFVAADLTANLLLAAGGTAVMTRRAQEVQDFAALAAGVCVNLGTLANEDIDPMAEAARTAIESGKPWVLDPVAVAASEDRRAIARRFAGLQPTVIRGNPAEILSLGDEKAGVAAGVDSPIESVEALDAAHDLAKASGALVAVTGTVDYVTDGAGLVAVANGHPLMAKVTGVGCALSALIAACCAVEPDTMAATAHALAILGVAGEQAGARAAGPASFRTSLIDALYTMERSTLEADVRIQ